MTTRAITFDDPAPSIQNPYLDEAAAAGVNVLRLHIFKRRPT